MKNNFNFTRFCSIVEKKGVKSITNQFSINYCLMVLINAMETKEIDFNQFSFTDLVDVEEILDFVITDEDVQGNIFLDPKSPFTQIMALGCKNSKMLEIPHYHAATPFMFI